MSFRDALELTKRIKTEPELIAKFGPPNYVATFDPGHAGDALPLNELPRDSWSGSEVFIPPTLIDNLPVGTKMVMNQFNTGSYFMVTGALVAYVDARGHVLGWSYSISLRGKYGDLAYLEDLHPSRGDRRP